MWNWKNFCVKQRSSGESVAYDLLDLDHGQPLAVAVDQLFFHHENLSLFGKVRRFLFRAPASKRYMVEGRPEQRVACTVYYRIPVICEVVTIEDADGHYLGGFRGPTKWQLWKCNQVRVYGSEKNLVGEVIIRRESDQNRPFAETQAQNVIGTVFLHEEARADDDSTNAAACTVRADDGVWMRKVDPMFLVAVALALLTSRAQFKPLASADRRS